VNGLHLPFDRLARTGIEAVNADGPWRPGQCRMPVIHDSGAVGGDAMLGKV
jgi:hypothetical protein